MKNTVRKIFAILMAFAMVFQMIPATAFAEPDDPSIVTEPENFGDLFQQPQGSRSASQHTVTLDIEEDALNSDIPIFLVVRQYNNNQWQWYISDNLNNHPSIDTIPFETYSGPAVYSSEAGVDVLLVSKNDTYRFANTSIQNGDGALTVYQEYSSINNCDGFQLYNTIAGKYNQKDVSITPIDGDHTKVTIGNPVTYTYHSARVEFYDAWSDTANSEKTVPAGYTLQVSDGTDTYSSSSITGNVFSFGSNDLKSSATGWEFSYNGAILDNIDGYVIDTEHIDTENVSGSNTEKQYVIPLRHPKTYTASINFYRAGESEPTTVSLANTEYFILKATDNNGIVHDSDTIYFGGSITFNDGELLVPECTSFEFVNANTNQPITEITANGRTYILSTSYTNNPETDHGYIFEAREPQTCEVNVDYIGDTSGMSSGGYFVVARKDNSNVAWALIDGSSTQMTFSPSGITIDDNTSFWIVKTPTESTSIDSLSSITGYDHIDQSNPLGEYSFSWDPAPTTGENPSYTISVEKRLPYTADITFLNVDGTTASSVTLDEGYTLEATGVTGETYSAAVTGTTGVLSFTPSGMMEISSFVLKKDNADQHMTLGSYNLSYTVEETNHAYHFTAAPAGEITVRFNFLDKEGNPVAPGSGKFGNTKVMVSIGESGTDSHWIAEKTITFNDTDKEYSLTFDSDTTYIGTNYNPQTKQFSPGDPFEVYFGMDLNRNDNTGLPQSNGTLIEDGDALGKFLITKTTIGNTVVYTGQELPPYLIEVKFQNQVYQEEAPVNLGTYYVYAGVVKGSNTYLWDKELNQMTTNSTGTVYNDSISYFSNRTWADPAEYYFAPNDQINIGLISGTPSYNNNIPTTPLLTVGDAVGTYAISSIRNTTENGSPKTTITLTKTEPYTYTFSVKNSSDAESAVNLPADQMGNWCLISRLKKENGDEYYGYIPLDLDGKGTTPITGSINFNLIYQNSNTSNASAVYVGGDSVNTVLVHLNSNVTSDQAARAIEVAFGKNNYSGVAYKNGSGFEQYAVTSMDASGVATVELKEAEAPSILISYLDTNGTTKLAGDELLDQDYYVYAQFAGDNNYGFVQKLEKNNTANTSEVINNVTFTKRDDSNLHKYVVGDASFNVYLVQSINGTAPTINDCYNTMFNNSGLCTFISDGAVVESAQLDLGEAYGNKNHPAEVIIQKIPPITVSSAVNPVMGSNVENKYYLLLEMTDHDQEGYALCELDTSVGAKSDYPAIEYLTNADGSGKYYYTGSEALKGYIITTPTAITLEDAVGGAGTRFESDALTGDLYKTGIEVANRNVAVSLDQITVGAGEDHEVEINFYGKDTDNLQLEAINPALTGSYYVLATLTEKDTGAKGNVIAYSIREIDISDQRTGQLTVSIPGEATDEDRFIMINFT